MLISVIQSHGDPHELQFVSHYEEIPKSQAPRVIVIFTDLQGTRAALQYAVTLAKDLSFDVELVIAELVPFPLPITSPAVPVGFRISQVFDLVTSTGTQPDVHIYLCRDPVDALTKVLPQNSPVVIGFRNTWFPTKEKRLARRLQQVGYQVILTLTT